MFDLSRKLSLLKSPDIAKVLLLMQTPYGRAAVIQVGNLLELYSGKYRQSAMLIDKPYELVLDYTKHLHLAIEFNPDVRRILFIGGGGFSVPKNISHMYPDIEIDVVEIDPVVIAIAKKYFCLEPTNKLRVFNHDGRAFLLKRRMLINNEDKGRHNYDLIFLDAFSENSVPSHLVTLEYFKMVAENLSQNGVFTIVCVSPLQGEKSKMWRAIYKTCQQVFQSLYVFRTFHEDPYKAQALILISTKAHTKCTKQELKRKVLRNNLPTVLDDSRFIEEHLYQGEVMTEDVDIIRDSSNRSDEPNRIYSSLKKGRNPADKNLYANGKNNNSIISFNFKDDDIPNTRISLFSTLLVQVILYLRRLRNRSESV